MKFRKITVTKNEAPEITALKGGNYETLLVVENHVLATAAEEKTNRCENEMWIMDEKGVAVLMYINDVRFTGMYADVMRFTGYLATHFKKYKRGLKVDINVWN